MEPSRPLFAPLPQFFALLVGIGLVWIGLALLSWLMNTPIIRTLLVLFTGSVLMVGFVWYAMTSWAWRRGQITARAYLRPALLLLFGWLLCLGSALATTLVWHVDNDKVSVSPMPPSSKVFPNEPRRFLSDLDAFDVQSGPLPVTPNGQLGNGKDVIRVNGLLSPKGISMHPPWAPKYASAKYRLEREAAVFKAVVAVNDTTNWCWSPATFTVLGDGSKLWDSKPIAHNQVRSQECKVDVSGVNVLELRVQCVNGSDGAHAVWVEPRLLQQADTPDEK
jgi:hypothetical protein